MCTSLRSAPLSKVFIRRISLNSAINRGVRKSDARQGRSEKPSTRHRFDPASHPAGSRVPDATRSRKYDLRKNGVPELRSYKAGHFDRIASSNKSLPDKPWWKEEGIDGSAAKEGPRSPRAPKDAAGAARFGSNAGSTSRARERQQFAPTLHPISWRKDAPRRSESVQPQFAEGSYRRQADTKPSQRISVKQDSLPSHKAPKPLLGELRTFSKEPELRRFLGREITSASVAETRPASPGSEEETMYSRERRGQQFANKATWQLRGREDENLNSLPRAIRRRVERERRTGVAQDNLSDSETVDATEDELPSKGPIAVPHTTSASEFLYGTSAVLAALQSARRKLYKLYTKTALSVASDGYNTDGRTIVKLAESLDLKHIALSDTEANRLMDKMSGGRPHNGYVLEASPLPKLPITALEGLPSPRGGFRVTLANQTLEDQAINGTNPNVVSLGGRRRFPLVLMLDGVQDPGNFGAMIRTAQFLGVSALAFVPRKNSPLSPVVIKASAGAAESLPILAISTYPTKFIEQSRSNGWKFYGAVPPPMRARRPFAEPNAPAGSGRKKHLNISEVESVLDEAPTVLILGGEGEGISLPVLRALDATVFIEQGHRPPGLGKPPSDLDSLNVSVATGLLCWALLRGVEKSSDIGPKAVAGTNVSGGEGASSVELSDETTAGDEVQEETERLTDKERLF